MPELAGDEHDAAPLLALEHPLQIMTRQPDAAHHIDLEHFCPVGILDVEERLGLVDAEIVDEDVDIGELRGQRRAALGAAEIQHRGVQLRRWRRLPDLCKGLIDCRLLAPVDDDFRAHLRKPRSRREPDAARRSGDERALSGEVDIHAFPLLVACWLLLVDAAHFAGGTIKTFHVIAGPGWPWKKRCVVIVSCSKSLPFSFIQASQTGNRPSVVSQTPMKPSRFASSSDVRPDDQTSPGVNGAG